MRPMRSLLRQSLIWAGFACCVPLLVGCGSDDDDLPPTPDQPGVSAPAPSKSPKSRSRRSEILISPVYNQLLMHSLPADFGRPSEEFFDDSNFLRQAVLSGETAENWTQKLSVTGIEGMATEAQVTPALLKKYFVQGLRQSCQESFSIAEDLPAEGVAPGFETTLFVASCGSSPAAPEQSETTLFVIIAGLEDYYTLQWAERGRASSGPLNIDRSKWRKRLAELMPIRLCDIIPGEGPPYPSCSGR